MDFINIIGTLFDNSINHIVALAHLIKDLRLNKNLLDINEELYNKIDLLKNKDSINHIFMSLALYDSLNSYEKDTLYFIVENYNLPYSVFGDTFPFILGKPSSSKFGDTFPLTLN